VDDARRTAVQNAVAAWEQLAAARGSAESTREAIRANEIALEGVEREAIVGSRTTLDVLSFRAIASALNARGIPTARGGQCPTDATPSASRSSVVRSGRSKPSIWLSANADAYCSRPSPRSHPAMSVTMQPPTLVGELYYVSTVRYVLSRFRAKLVLRKLSVWIRSPSSREGAEVYARSTPQNMGYG
jgi:hypothetical protein